MAELQAATCAPRPALQQRNAQQTMEREYERIRSAEMRYRLLFQLASEPVLIVDVAAEKLSEANPAAIKLIRPAAQAGHGPCAC